MARRRKSQRSARIPRRRISTRRRKQEPIFTLLLHFIETFFVTIGRPIYYAIVYALLYALVFFGIGVPHILSVVWWKITQAFVPPPVVTKPARAPTPPHRGFWQRVRTAFRPVAQPLGLLVEDTPPSFFVGVAAAFLATGLSAFFYFYVLKDLPSPRELITREQIVTTKIYDRNGVLLYKIYKDENRTLVPLTAIPNHLKQATIAIEDQDFYKHNGFSIRGILRAVKSNLERKKVEGGSTITQQLIKNTLLTPEKTIRRKLREVVLAVMVETTLTKDEILEMYFNEVSFGGSVYGVEEASRRYFGKSVRNLTMAEAAYLAGLPQAPSAYSPYGPTPELGIARQHQVLQRMVEDGYISLEQAAEAREEKIEFEPDINDIKAPHFVMYVRDVLARQFGEEVVSQGGLEVVTTLDYELQKQTETAVDQELERVQRFRISNGAALVTNPKTGGILAMVGSRNYFDTRNDGQVNVTLRPRQPGSSIKPLTYAVAFEKGMTPSTIVDDSPITYRVVGSPPYSPRNYDGQFHGRVTIRQALASSYNVPAVKTLATVGVGAVVDKGREMGITSWGEENAVRFGLSLTLGGGEVTMLDMSKLYGTFANQGVTVQTDPLLSVTNYKGEILYENPCKDESAPCRGARTLDPKIAYQITDILKDNNARAPAFGFNSVLNIPQQEVAVKTGTTNSLRDNWTIGYTNERLVASWVGNNDNSPMSYVASGITGASPIWNTIMRTLLSEETPNVFTPPQDLVKVRICATTGTLPCSACPVQRDELFVPGTQPTRACTDAMFASPSPAASPGPGQILEGASTTR